MHLKELIIICLGKYVNIKHREVDHLEDNLIQIGF